MLVTPVLFLVMFTYLFGGAVEGSTQEYLQFLLPGMLVQSVLFTAVYSGVALNTDMTKGVVDRFRSLPIWSPAPLVGAVIGDSVRFAIAATVVVLVGLIMGFDAGGGVGGVLAAMALVIVYAFALSWVFTTLGLVLRSPERGAEHRLHVPVPADLPQQHLRRPLDAAELARGVRRRQPDLAPDDRRARADVRHGERRRGRRCRWRWPPRSRSSSRR